MKGWLVGREYAKKMIKKEVLGARSIQRKQLLEKEHREKKQLKLTLNISYYSVFQNVKEIVEDLHVLLTPDYSHKIIFDEILRFGFKNNRSLKDDHCTKNEVFH